MNSFILKQSKSIALSLNRQYKLRVELRENSGTAFTIFVKHGVSGTRRVCRLSRDVWWRSGDR